MSPEKNEETHDFRGEKEAQDSTRYDEVLNIHMNGFRDAHSIVWRRLFVITFSIDVAISVPNHTTKLKNVLFGVCG